MPCSLALHPEVSNRQSTGLHVAWSASHLNRIFKGKTPPVSDRSPWDKVITIIISQTFTLITQLHNAIMQHAILLQQPCTARSPTCDPTFIQPSPGQPTQSNPLIQLSDKNATTMQTRFKRHFRFEDESEPLFCLTDDKIAPFMA